MARLQELYKNEIVASLMKKFGYKSIMQVPKLEKITLNMGVGEAVTDKKVMTFEPITITISHFSTKFLLPSTTLTSCSCCWHCSS